MLKRILTYILMLAIMAVPGTGLAETAPAAFKPAARGTASFNADGKFKLLVFADVQDTQVTSMFLLEMMNKVLDVEKPDMVVFLGDQLEGWNPIMFALGNKETSTKGAIDNILEPIVSRGIPFAVTFGNHDSEAILTRDEQLAIYMSYPGCLSYDAEPEIPGSGNCSIQVMSSDGSHPALNFYMIDSLDYEPDGSYGLVTKEQIDWTTRESARLTAENGGTPIPSLVFQHIIVPEIYDILPEAENGEADAMKGKAYGKGRTYSTNPQNFIEGELNETPSPANKTSGQFAGWVAQGDVMAGVFGHDHMNTFIVESQGIRLISAPGSTYTAYNDDSTRGVRIFEFDENDVEGYTTRFVRFEDMYEGSLVRNVWRYITSTTSHFFYSGIKMFIIPAAVIIILATSIPLRIRRKRKKQKRENA